MSGSKLLPLYEQIARLIQSEIERGKFAPGEKIYSIREICEAFSVSDVTAKKSLRELANRGFVRSVTGSGVFVKEPQQSEQRPQSASVAFLKVGFGMAPVFTTEIDLLQRELAKIGCSMAYSTAPEEEDVVTAVEQLLLLKPRALVVFPQHRGEFERLSYLGMIRRAGVPLLILETRSGKDSYVTADTERATQELVNYLYELGHRRICLATGFPRKVTGFEAAIRRWNDPQLKTWVLPQPGKTAQDALLHAQQILALSPRPTALITSSDHDTGHMILHLQAAGVRVPEEMSVVTYGDAPHDGPLSEIPLTLVRHPVQELVQEVVSWVRATADQEGPRRVLRREVSGSLIVRDSSGPPMAQ